MSLSPKEEVTQVLLDIQEARGFLPREELERVATSSGTSVQELIGLASFYSRFRLNPSGEHRLSVCDGTACHVKGSLAIYDAFRNYLGIEEGQDTDRENRFTIEKVACLGCCMIAPAIQIDDIIYGNLSPFDVPSVLADFLETESSGDQAPLSGKLAKLRVGEVRLCLCSSCAAAGAGDLWKAFAAAGNRFSMKSVACTGISYEAPLVEIIDPMGNSYRYGKLVPTQVNYLIERHFPSRGLASRLDSGLRALVARVLSEPELRSVTRYLAGEALSGAKGFWDAQKRIVMEGYGERDPLDLDEYRESGGFEALRKAIERDDPAWIVSEILASGLRGRGGGGFPTGEKWNIARAAVARSTGAAYVICNGDEGDPGAFMDRMLLESFPFRVLEGMAIAAIALGAREAFLYIRAEYPLAVKRTKAAIKACVDAGLFGGNALGKTFDFSVSVVRGAGAFVCGEETALIAGLSGERGAPRQRPPYPSEKGFRGRPTIVNNVETFCLVPWILRSGSLAFSTIGSRLSPGTKTFALAGKIKRGGLIEIETGKTIEDIVVGFGGGAANGAAIKALQVGGPSGGCVPTRLFNTKVDYEDLLKAGAFMGSGGMVVLDEGDCMVEIARYFLEFSRKESCGKCAPCRVGTTRLLEILDRFVEGRAVASDIELLEKTALEVRELSLCGLGSSAPNPVLSTLANFREEYEAHVAGLCPAKVCKSLFRYEITDDCIGCTKCRQACPEGAIAFTPFEKHSIDKTKCTRCGLCFLACPSKAVVKR